MPGYSQAQSCSAEVATAAFINPVKTFENTVDMFAFNAGALIGDVNFQKPVMFFCRNSDDCFRRAVFNGVIDQVDNRLL